MSTESQLREKLRKIEALFAGAGTTGVNGSRTLPRGRLRRGPKRGRATQVATVFGLSLIHI